MHIALQWALEHFPVEALSMQSEAIASLSRGSYETSGSGIFFLSHIYYSLYIGGEAKMDIVLKTGSVIEPVRLSVEVFTDRTTDSPGFLNIKVI
jgi:hypothetical protein